MCLYFSQPYHRGEVEMKGGDWASLSCLLRNMHLAKAKALGVPESSLSVEMGRAEPGLGAYLLHMVVVSIQGD